MTSQASSDRKVLRATSLIGSAAVGSILIGLMRMKVFALLIGPSGIGLLGLLTAVQATAAAVASIGTASSGVRYLAAAIGKDDGPNEGGQDDSEMRWNFWSLTVLLAGAGGLVVFLFRRQIALLSMGQIDAAPAIGWLSLSVGFSVIAGAQLAVLQAHRRIADIARVQIGGALLGAVGGIAVVWAMGTAGIVPALIMVPAGTMFAACWRRRTVPAMRWIRPVPASFFQSWKMLLALGAAMMVSGFIGMATQIAVRAAVARDLGLDAAGLYQAGWTISVTNIGLVLTAMAADYFPRLSAVAGNSDAEQELMNQQLRIGLLICAPLIMGLTALAPLALHILYSSQFEPAATFLRWQMLGDIFKLGGWALGYVMIARNDRVVFLMVEISFALVYLPVALIFGGIKGLDAVGAGYALAYFVYFAIGATVCGLRYGVMLDRRNMTWLAIVAALTAGLIALSLISPILVTTAGLVSAAILGLKSILTLAGMISEGDQPTSHAQRFASMVAFRLGLRRP